jgi:hypothetical protein
LRNTTNKKQKVNPFVYFRLVNKKGDLFPLFFIFIGNKPLILIVLWKKVVVAVAENNFAPYKLNWK